MNQPITNEDLDRADALLDAVRMRVAGNLLGSGMKAIPVIKQDPIQTCAVLMGWIDQAVHAYADTIGLDPVEAVDRLWSKPRRPITEEER